MGFETPEEAKQAKQSITPEQANLSETREVLLAKIKSDSEGWVDSDSFDSIVASLKFEEESKDKGNFSFSIRGHEIRGRLVEDYFMYMDSVDGQEVSPKQSDDLSRKYGHTVKQIIYLDNPHIKENVKTLNSTVEDLLKD